MSGDRDLFDVTIIGGGSAGLYAAYYAGMREMKTKLIESRSKLGGTVAVFFPEKNIYDIGGIPKITGRDFVKQMTEQALLFDPAVVLGQTVEKLEKQADGTFLLTSANGETHASKTVIIAVGPGVFHLRRLELEDLDRYNGTHIHHEPEDLTDFYGKRVLIYGGLGSAIKMTYHLADKAEKVYLVYNRDTFSGFEKDIEQIKHLNVDIRTSRAITGFHEDGASLSEVYLEHAHTGAREAIAVDDVIIAQGYHCDLSLVKRWGFSLEGRRMPVDHNMATPLEGVYAIGDIAGYPKKWRLIASTFNEAITAVNSAKACLDPSAPAQVYSTILMD
ncbi:NAD(P)/FAD-dependent oxidoreductase [Camelliibacillus cellulosilyticus]|uniref:Ferredoxin--NADP reductase n=1 Tax=Camelliibacillus cellulosilyticus TaxID=2174486 RepID=A0ABV9GL65_9BACL